MYAETQIPRDLALRLTAPAQILTAPAQPPATEVVMYTALFGFGVLFVRHPVLHQHRLRCPMSTADPVFLGCCWEDKCKDYRGNLAVTVSGRKCQRWDSDKPHRRNNDVK